MDSMTRVDGPVHLGMDVAKNMIVVGIVPPGMETPAVDRIANDEPSVRRLVDRFEDRSRLRVCYEAGPTGFGLYRLLRSMGVACDVVAPSLIPKAPGDRVKTDKRDARRLARLHRAGELVAIAIPTPEQEAVRDLCRARAALVTDRARTRQRLDKFLLRHDRVYRDGSKWTMRHEQWLVAQRFEDAALRSTYGHYRAVLSARDAEVSAVEAALTPWFDRRLWVPKMSSMQVTPHVWYSWMMPPRRSRRRMVTFVIVAEETTKSACAACLVTRDALRGVRAKHRPARWHDRNGRLGVRSLLFTLR